MKTEPKKFYAYYITTAYRKSNKFLSLIPAYTLATRLQKYTSLPKEGDDSLSPLCLAEAVRDLLQLALRLIPPEVTLDRDPAFRNFTRYVEDPDFAYRLETHLESPGTRLEVITNLTTLYRTCFSDVVNHTLQDLGNKDSVERFIRKLNDGVGALILYILSELIVAEALHGSNGEVE